MLVMRELMEEATEMERDTQVRHSSGEGAGRVVCLAGLALVASLCGACKMGHDYARPQTPSTDSWRVAPATSESIANMAWWDLLKDQELQNLIRIALVENQDVRTAVA